MGDKTEKRIEEMEEKIEELSEERGSFSSLMTGILIGGLIGAGLALLSAPRSGIETREILRARGNELKEKAIDRADEARGRAEELARTGSNRATELKLRGQEVIQEQKATLAGVVEGIKEGVRTYKEFDSGDHPSHADLPAQRPPHSLMEIPEANPPAPTDLEPGLSSPETGREI